MDTIKPLLSDSNLIDELITVRYATGNRSTLSGSVNRVNEGEHAFNDLLAFGLVYLVPCWKMLI